MVKKKKTARKAPKKGARRPGKAKKTVVRKAVRKPALKSSRKAASARKSAGKKSPRAAAKKAKSSRPAGSRKAGLAAAASVVPLAAAASTSGEDYGRESWREEEISAAEIDTDAPELDELEADSELDEPVTGGDGDEEAEW